MSTSRSLYRPLFLSAWEKTRTKPHLWVLGFIATFFATGGITSILLQAGLKIQGGFVLLQAALKGALFSPPTDWIQWLATISTPTLTFFITLWTIVALFLLVLLPVAQGALLLGLSERKPPPLATLIYKVSQHTHELLVLAVGAFLFHHTVLFALIALLFGLQLQEWGGATLFSIIALCFLIPLGIGIQMLHLLAVIDVVQKGKTAFVAIHDALTCVRRHFIVFIETGLLVSTVQLVACILFFIALQCIELLGGVLAGMLGLLQISLGPNLILWMKDVVVFLSILFFLAGLTTWSYAVWVRLCELTGFAQAHLVVRSKIVRVLKGR